MSNNNFYIISYKKATILYIQRIGMEIILHYYQNMASAVDSLQPKDAFCTRLQKAASIRPGRLQLRVVKAFPLKA